MVSMCQYVVSILKNLKYFITNNIYFMNDILFILAYHTKCIDPWLTKNRRVCPVCKRKVFAADEQVVTDESDSDADDTTPLIREGHQGIKKNIYFLILKVMESLTYILEK